MSIEGIGKRHLVSVKNRICKGTVLDLGAEPPRIKLFGVPLVDFPFHSGCSERLSSGESSKVQRKKRSTFGRYL